jgi:hypothetical protein
MCIIAFCKFNPQAYRKLTFFDVGGPCVDIVTESVHSMHAVSLCTRITETGHRGHCKIPDEHSTADSRTQGPHQIRKLLGESTRGYEEQANPRRQDTRTDPVLPHSPT